MLEIRSSIRRRLCSYLAMLIGLHGSAYLKAVDFERDVAPLISRHCLECHGSADASGGLDLTRIETFQRGGESGSILGNGVESSLLIQRVARGEMPPEKNGQSQRLTQAEIDVLRQWIAEGAKWPADRILDPFERTTAKRAGRDWWAWQPLQEVTLPTGVANDQAIDHFIRRELEKQSLSPAQPAERRVLLRRLYFDLLGLPPTYDQLQAFEQDDSPEAYEKVVDQLLASKHFGERWARHWLDLVRFAETNGYERDAVKPHAWKYRDWVIQAINDDMPYDQFVTQQLAGDEIPNRSESSVIATGFLRLGTWDDEPNDPLEYQYDRLEDLVHTTTTAFLGLTVKCARCHDHKFDAIPQTDYYRIAAAFWAGPVAHRKREWNGGPTREELGFDVLGWTDLSAQPPDLRLLKKGDVHRPMQVVASGSLSGARHLSREFSPPADGVPTSQRRLQLAQWIVDRQNPLTARVIVNRLWQHHFGEGLVRTPDNFGFLGSPPTHPALLDWLAHELMQHGWQLKRIHKLMVMSQTYQQSSVHPRQSEFAQMDAANRYWWRAERRRLDAEQLRDAILQCSGRLDGRIGGESFRAPINEEALEGLSMKADAYKASTPEEARRRSVYMFSKRSLAVPMMTVFDSCDTTAPTGRRDVSIVAPQALTLLNNPWVLEESRALAKLVLEQADEQDRVTTAWRVALGREPTAKEHRYTLEYVRAQKPIPGGEDEGDPQLRVWAALCHTLINTNEFIYID